MTPTCPYCRTPFEADDEVVTCPACGTAHHADCFAENGGCTVFGCSQAPVEEPKISVTSHDVSRPLAVPQHVAATGDGGETTPPPNGRRAPMPPPPRPAGWVPPPPRPGEVVIRTGMPIGPRPFTFGGYVGAELPNTFDSRYVVRKSRVVYVLMAIFFGIFGVHNFYAGYIKKAVIQLCITLFTCFYGIPIIWIWAIIEACMINSDDDGVAFT
jgi:TM2 domain/Prokaryotic RING finger family 1